MMLSLYFEDLTKAYQAELEDLQSDSDGNDMLSSRLKDKRSQFALMMPMIGSAPEMVAVAFHGGISYANPQALTMLSSYEPDEFPAWDLISDAVQFSDWAEKLTETVLQEPDGERFLITCICLEYLHEKNSGTYQGAYQAAADVSDDAVEGVEGDDDDERDLESEGADWLAGQGFDRLS